MGRWARKYEGVSMERSARSYEETPIASGFFQRLW